jgi:hypothetical protein
VVAGIETDIVTSILGTIAICQLLRVLVCEANSLIKALRRLFR